MCRSPSCDEKGLKKGPWTPEEDPKLINYMRNQVHGHGSWKALPRNAGLNRCGKSCRLRWTNYLRPDIKRGKFSDEEQEVIINLHSVHGSKWSRIAAQLPGRTDNEIKNLWNIHLRKKLLLMGIDPITHKPVSDLNLLLNLSKLVSTPNFNNLMNPWDNALRLQTDATQLAKIQLFQNILQIINTIPLSNIEQTSFLGSQNYAQIDGLLNGTRTVYTTEQSQSPFKPSNLGFTPQVFNDYSVITNSLALSTGGLRQEVLDFNDNIPLPALVLETPESSIVNRMESTEPAYFSAHSPTSNFFEEWEKLMDDEASSSSWRDIIH
ncbi:unnamed protein product [Ilex paraguariensis]|uniref:Uncharacterized protein n=1 Tax=Ilex paraguariensis TaxID=185542 RepID=A0ABC8TWY4_9AQUA